MNAGLRVLAALLFCGLVAAANPVGPFGVKFGQPIASLKMVDRFGESGSLLVEVPQPHPLLGNYAVKADKAGGVCMIDGIAALPTDDEGHLAIKTFTALRDELNAAYGAGDPGRSGPRLPAPGPDFWNPETRDKDALYTMVWSKKTGAGFPADSGIKTVMLVMSMQNRPIVHVFYFSEKGCG